MELFTLPFEEVLIWLVTIWGTFDGFEKSRGPRRPSSRIPAARERGALRSRGFGILVPGTEGLAAELQ
jgi:hypothetical protein